MGLSVNEPEESYWAEENVLNWIIVIVAYLSKFTKNH